MATHSDPPPGQLAAPRHRRKVGDETGRVVGMVVGKLDALRVAELTGDIPQNVNFAVKASVLLNFLEAQGVETETAARAPARRDADLATASREITVRVDCLR